MTKKSLQPYFFIFLFLILLLSLPRTNTEQARGAAASFMTPFWNRATNFKLFLYAPLTYFNEKRYPSTNGLELTAEEEIARLQLENQMLHSALKESKEMLQAEKIAGKASSQVVSMPAQVIFRSRHSWNNSLWLNVGEADNALIGTEIVAKNSPVVLKSSVIGVVDYVGKHQCRVRLITDSAVTPSVRVARGDIQTRLILEHLDIVIEQFRNKMDTLDDESKAFFQKLATLKERLSKSDPTLLLAKGELQGSSKPLWRTDSQILRGIGFNYDFSDSEGPARDLRTGKVADNIKNVATVPIVQENDLLVTTGMDGVFPAGLQVAIVTKINPLREGDYYYELEAKPTAGSLEDLTTVFVIPPVGFNKSERPPLLGEK